MASWSSSAGERVLAVAPHPDDESIACGGTLALHAGAGDRVAVLFVTDGRRSRAFGLPPDEMARRRRAEAERAARALGAEAIWLGLEEGTWTQAEWDSGAPAVIETFAPTIVYAPSRVDFHPEHVRVAFALAPILLRLAPSALVRVFQAQVPLTSLLTNLVVPVAPVLAPLTAALDAYETQAGNIARAIRQRRYAAAYHALDGSAEELWQMDVPRYSALHAGAREPSRRFRGVRSFPASDPLAYTKGRAERRALARGF